MTFLDNKFILDTDEKQILINEINEKKEKEKKEKEKKGQEKKEEINIDDYKN
jgi:hypothetical protein